MSVEWYTPEWIFKDLGLVFDTDPCSPFDFDVAVPTKIKYTIFDDGLKKPWFGKVWLNPPFGRGIADWTRRLIFHGNGICLCFSRTDTEWYQELWAAAEVIILLRRRIGFIPGHENKGKNKKAGHRSASGVTLFGFGDSAAAIMNLEHKGIIVKKEEKLCAK